jgi:glycosyltransferase involved in cell wall biosynthesis
MLGVLMLINEFPPVPPNGTERQAERLAVYMAGRNVRVVVLTRKYARLPGREWRDGFEVIRVPQFGPGKLRTVVFTFGAVLSILRQRATFDILHAHLANAPAVAATLAGRLLRKKVIVKFGNIGPFGDIQVSQRSWHGRLVLAMLRSWTDVCIVLTTDMEGELLAAGFPRTKIVKLNNGVDTSEFSPAPTDGNIGKRASDSDDVVVMFAGRLSPIKALDVLLQAFSSALVTCPGLQLLLVGEGEERGKLEALARDLGIEGRLSFVGRVPDVKPFLRKADIFVLPSYSEGMSNSLLEAMSMGLACIATRIASSTQLLGDGAHGLLVAPGDAGQLARAITLLAENRQEAARLGARARTYASEHYDFSALGNAYFGLYQQLVQR